MFNNIGRKIKMLAEVLCWIGITVSVLAAVLLFVSGVTEDNPHAVLFGLLLVVLGPLLSWIGSFLLYGFGELVTKTSRIAALLEAGSAGRTGRPDEDGGTI